MSEVYFSSIKVEKLEADKTLPKKFERMLEQLDIRSLVSGKKVCVKMHLGGNVGYTTIHPLFVRTLVQQIKKAGCKSVFVCDGSKKGANLRGYTKKSVGTKIVGLFRRPGLVKKIPIGYKKLDEAEISKEVLNSDVLIVLSHLKGHGSCGFGGAGKNIAMGVVPGKTRGKIHSLEGGIDWDKDKCTKCEKCIQECPNKANKFNDKGDYEIFYHNCTYCRHCILACPQKSLTISPDGTFENFSKGLALVVKETLKNFEKSALFINFLMNITIFCDCWGFSTPSLVPDLGIVASKDIVAVEKASLDMIKVENLNKIGLPDGKELTEGNHLFEKIHGKDPYLMGNYMKEMGLGSSEYKILDIK
jgi:uncharacterized protein